MKLIELSNHIDNHCAPNSAVDDILVLSLDNDHVHQKSKNYPQSVEIKFHF